MTESSNLSSRSAAESARPATAPTIVGVGASAGGLEAFREFLQALGSDVGAMCVVYIQHQDPDAKRLLSELIDSSTDLKVVEVNGRRKLQAGCIYVAPPHRLMSLSDSSINLVSAPAAEVSAEADTESDADAGATMSTPADRADAAPSAKVHLSITDTIDPFFHELAEKRGTAAIGIILSGVGSDGTLGLKAISDAGGLSFAQAADTARYDSMPRQAAITGVADHVLAPREIAAELKKYLSHMQSVSSAGQHKRLMKEVTDAIPLITECLLKQTSHNFQHYKSSTLARRIQRRMQVLKLADVNDYIRHLDSHTEESRALFRELLIGVTAFFRDADAFDTLQHKVLPELFANRPNDEQVRIWVAGCATGQEAYSMAMLCLEHRATLEDPPDVQIFATDIDERALQIARQGIYPAGIVEELSEARLKRFFIKRGSRFHVTKEVRERVLFSAHNLISDPPFSRQDLVSCRNLLIYLGPHLQKKLIPLFHYALRPSGYLFLGPSENISSHRELFRVVDARHRMSQRKGTAINAMSTLALRDSAGGEKIIPRVAAHTEPPETDIAHMMQRIMLDEFAPKAVVIDADGQILSASADMQKYLTVASGNFENNVIKMARSGLRIGLRAAIKQASTTRRRTEHENLSVQVEGMVQQVMLTVQPMPQLGMDAELFMVVFHDVGLPFDRLEQNTPAHAAAITTVPDAGDGSAGDVLRHSHIDVDAIIAQLERELTTTRNDLEKTMQDMEAGNEELKSSNEELLSMNEELQSTNEELETSKEEIQAGSDALAQANSDLENLLLSTDIATIFLDDDLNIRRFTPAAQEIYGLIATDVGRPLSQLMPLADNMPDLPSVSRVRAGEVFEDTIKTRAGKSFVRRVLPYHSYNGTSEGMVVTFTDVTELLNSEAILLRSLDAANMDAFQLDLNTRQIVRRGSLSRALSLAQVSSAQDHIDRVHMDDRPAWQAAIEQATPGAAAYTLTYRYLLEEHDEHDERWLREDGEVLFDDKGTAVQVVGTCLDVTDAKTAELAMAIRERQLRTITDALPVLIAYVDNKQRYQFVNAEYAREFGKHPDELLGNKAANLMSPENYAQIKPHLEKALKGHEETYDFNLLRAGSDQPSIKQVTYLPDFDEQGRVLGCHVLASDITQVKRNQEFLEQRERESLDREAHLRRVINNQLGLVGVISRDGTLLEVDDGSLAITGVQRTDVLGKHFADTAFWSHDPSVAQQIREAMDSAFEGEIVRFDAPLNNGGNQHLMIDFMMAPVFDDEGKVEYLIPSGVDISKRKRAELKLQASEFRLQLGVDVAKLVLADVDYVSDTIRLTAEAAALFGLGDAATEVSREQVHATFHTEDRETIIEQVNRVLGADSDGQLACQHRITLPNGDTRWVDVRKQILFTDPANSGEARRPVSAVLAARDITEEKLVEDRLQESEQRFRSMVDDLPSLIWLHDKDGNQQTVNRTFCEFFGLSDMRDMDWQELLHPDDVERYVNEFTSSVSEQREFYDQVRVKRADGQWRWMESRGNPRWSLDGEYLGYLGASVDITGRKQTEQNLVEALQSVEEVNAQLRGVVDNSVILLGIVDEDGVLQQVNETATLGAGYERDAGIGLPFWQGPWWTGREEWQERVRQMVFKAFAGESSRLQLPYWVADGSKRMVDFAMTPAMNDAGQVKFVVPSGYDITEQHHYEEALQEARRLAEVANESKSAFVANMSHEIRTPMSAVLGYADLLARREQDPEKSEYLRVIKRNGNFLLDIINDILDVSKMEAGMLSIERTWFAADEVINDVLSMMDVRASEKRLVIDVEYVGSIPARIHSDNKRLKQILVNLIGNAIKFTETGGVQLLVRYLTEPTACLCFDVVDTGIGISTEQQERLFQPFAQADDSFSRNFGGTGLGLVISQRLAILLGGEITLESEPGTGSRFSCQIAVGDVSDEPLIDPVIDNALQEFDTLVSEITLDCQVLVVDDRKDVRLMVKQFLEDANARVLTAVDGIDALDTVKNHSDELNGPIDLMLLDMQMPRLDGYATATRLRESGFEQPIIALTADALQADMAFCLQSGCDAYLSKPVDSLALLNMIDRYTRKLPRELIKAERVFKTLERPSSQLPGKPLGDASSGAGSERSERDVLQTSSKAESAETAELAHLSMPTVSTESQPSQSQAANPGNQHTLVSAASQRRGLIVDDARDVCRSLQKLMQLKGFEAECAYTGATALELAATLKPSIVILDISLPDMSGLDLVKAIKALPGLTDAFYVALSGHAGPEHEQRSLDAGFHHHLSKPVDIDDLVQVIESSG